MAGTLQERMDELIEDAERATEVMRQVDPDAAPVRVPLREWRACVRDKAKLEHQIAEEMGQLAQHTGQFLHETNDSYRMRFLGLTNSQKSQELAHGPQLPDSDDTFSVPGSLLRRSLLPSPAELEQRLQVAIGGRETHSVGKHLKDARELLSTEYSGPEGPVDFMPGEPVPDEDVSAGHAALGLS